MVAPPGWTGVQLGLPLASSIVQLGLPTSQLGHYSLFGSSLAVVQLGPFCQALGIVCALV